MNQAETLKALDGATVISVPLAARILDMSVRGAYRAASAGKLPAIRIGGAVRIPTAPLRAMLGLAA